MSYARPLPPRMIVFSYIESAPLNPASFKGQIAWQGEVEIFQLVAHPKTGFCYAVGFRGRQRRDEGCHGLALPPVDSALKAVQVFIASTVKGNHAEG